MVDTHSAPVRSYVLRNNRLTAAQARALKDYWRDYCIDLQPGTRLDLPSIFGQRCTNITLEIGFGNGAALASMAENNPQFGFLGIEVYRPGIGRLLRALHERQLSNVHVICEDAATVLNDYLPDGVLTKILLLFPDPWPKKRHHKRRLIQGPFVQLLCTKLKPGGIVHLATDWRPYAQQMLTLLNECPELVNISTEQGFALCANERPLTKFERRGRRLGNAVFDLIYRRI